MRAACSRFNIIPSSFSAPPLSRAAQAIHKEKLQAALPCYRPDQLLLHRRQFLLVAALASEKIVFCEASLPTGLHTEGVRDQAGLQFIVVERRETTLVKQDPAQLDKTIETAKSA